ncbi:tryptophan 2,3-dioxygenase family protein, partial [Nonomuraea angiospora]
RYLGSFRHASDTELARLRRRLEEPTLWDAYLTALSQRGLPVSDDEIMGSLLAVARDRGSYDDLWQLAEDLLTHDATAAQWRTRHVQMVERQIGTKSGTGGSTGAPYLRGRTRLHYFPLLWELRAWL